MSNEFRLEDVTDGKQYGIHDMVRVGCDDCEGCSACCRGMGTSIILDPYDMWNLERALGEDTKAIFRDHLEKHIQNGLILPNLKMAGKEETCTFLNEEGRCSIHPFRTGLCRLYPLGRKYDETENGGFSYILMRDACQKKDLTKVKLKKWIDIDHLPKNDAYHIRWHWFVRTMEQKMLSFSVPEQMKLAEYILKLFFEVPYRAEESFYPQFEKRMSMAERKCGIQRERGTTDESDT